MTGELLLDVEVVILHVGRFDVAIEGKGVALVVAACCGCEYGAAGNDRAADCSRRIDRLGGGEWIVGRTGIAIGRIRQVAESHIVRERVEEHTKTCADY